MTVQDLVLHASYITLSWLFGYGLGLVFKGLRQFIEKIKW